MNCCLPPHPLSHGTERRQSNKGASPGWTMAFGSGWFDGIGFQDVLGHASRDWIDPFVRLGSRVLRGIDGERGALRRAFSTFAEQKGGELDSSPLDSE